MKSNLAAIQVAIANALKAQGVGSKTWSSKVVVWEESSTTGASKTWWVRCDIPQPLLGETAMSTLIEAGVLGKKLKPVAVQRGRTTALCWKIDVDKLSKAVAGKSKETSTVVLLQRKVSDLEKKLKLHQGADSKVSEHAQLMHLLDTAFGPKRTAPAHKFIQIKPPAGKALGGVPTLFLSDWHYGEVVSAEQIQGWNEFNLGIAKERGARVMNTAMNLLFHHHSGRSYDGMVLALGGDMLSGNILEELRVSNEKTVLECALDLADMLSPSIVEMADQFQGIYVPCVSGNHGRLDKRPTIKNAVLDNLDWLVYEMVARQVQARMGSSCNVTFDISRSFDLTFRIYGTRFLMTHGDQIGEGTKSASFWPNIIETARRKQQRAAQAGGESFDYMMCGHFHRYGTLSNVIVNGSLKGYDEYAYRNNYEIERAVQAMWLTHPDCGIIGHEPIYADLRERDCTANEAPISFGPKVLNK